MDPYSVDPIARRFDHLLAIIAYGLLFVSVFTFWIPALVAGAIAFTHRREAHPLIASHFRFQLTIFWVGLALVAVAAVMLVAAGGFAISALWSAGISQPTWSWPAGAASGLTAGGLTLAALALFGLSAVWTLVTSIWGGYRLARGRGIGQRRGDRTLEIR